MVEIGLNPAKGDWVGQMMALQRDIRGGLIEAAILVERALDLILANHFCKPRSERWWQLYSMVLASGSVTFRRKSEVVQELLKLVYPNLLAKHPKIKADLKKVVDARNEVAHLESGTSAGFETGQPPDHINLIKYQSGRRVVRRVTRAEAAQEARNAKDLFSELSGIANAIARSST